MTPLKVLALCGSLRRGSYNRKLLALAVASARAAGADVTEFDLRDTPFPLYDGDIEEQGIPAPVRAFKELIAGADVLLVASPEYNYSIPGVLKNAIDWASRGGNAFKGKWAAVFGASSGHYGTVRGQAHLRLSLTAVNMLLLPQPQVMVSDAADAFNEDGTLKNEKTAEQLKTLVERTLAIAEKTRV